MIALHRKLKKIMLRRKKATWLGITIRICPWNLKGCGFRIPDGSNRWNPGSTNWILRNRSEPKGSVLYWGGMTNVTKERSRKLFQDSDAKVMIATKAAMVGIDLTAADALVFAQMPAVYPEAYQMADRLVRLDPHHRKKSVDIIRMIGVYGENATRPSFDQLMDRALLQGRRVFETVMDLPYANALLQSKVSEGIRKGLGI